MEPLQLRFNLLIFCFLFLINMVMTFFNTIISVRKGFAGCAWTHPNYPMWRRSPPLRHWGLFRPLTFDQSPLMGFLKNKIIKIKNKNKNYIVKNYPKIKI